MQHPYPLNDPAPLTISASAISRSAAEIASFIRSENPFAVVHYRHA